MPVVCAFSGAQNVGTRQPRRRSEPQPQGAQASRSRQGRDGRGPDTPFYSQRPGRPRPQALEHTAASRWKGRRYVRALPRGSCRGAARLRAPEHARPISRAQQGELPTECVCRPVTLAVMGRRSAVAEQLAYYRAVAHEYEDHAIDLPGQIELLSAIDAFRPAGHVLELACGPGIWTERLERSAASVTAVDGAAEMLARARARLSSSASVRFVESDHFSSHPSRRYDAVVFGFWISHVPKTGSTCSGASSTRHADPMGASSSSTTITGRRSNSSKASTRR